MAQSRTPLNPYHHPLGAVSTLLASFILFGNFSNTDVSSGVEHAANDYDDVFCEAANENSTSLPVSHM
jgi:hypothetical protein